MKKGLNLYILDGVLVFVIYIAMLCFLIITRLFTKWFILITFILSSYWFITKSYNSVLAFWEYYILKDVSQRDTIILGVLKSEKFEFFPKNRYIIVCFDDDSLGDNCYDVVAEIKDDIYQEQKIQVTYLKKSRVVFEVK